MTKSETELREVLTNLVSFGTNMDDECVYCGFGPDDDAEHATDCPMPAAQRALASIPAEPEQADEVAGLDERSYQIGLRAHRRRIAELQQAISDEYDAWVAVEDAQRARLAPARDDTND